MAEGLLVWTMAHMVQALWLWSAKGIHKDC